MLDYEYPKTLSLNTEQRVRDVAGGDVKGTQCLRQSGMCDAFEPPKWLICVR